MNKKKVTQIKPGRNIYLIGLSSKPNKEHLSPDTQTGKIVQQIVCKLPFENIKKTNLVREVPLDASGKLRYPDNNEMRAGWKVLKEEINLSMPCILVTFGQQVSHFLQSELTGKPQKQKLSSEFSYKTIESNNMTILPVHHPSFIYVYKRKNIDSYVDAVVHSIIGTMS